MSRFGGQQYSNIGHTQLNWTQVLSEIDIEQLLEKSARFASEGLLPFE